MSGAGAGSALGEERDRASWQPDRPSWQVNRPPPLQLQPDAAEVQGEAVGRAMGRQIGGVLGGLGQGVAPPQAAKAGAGVRAAGAAQGSGDELLERGSFIELLMGMLIVPHAESFGRRGTGANTEHMQQQHGEGVSDGGRLDTPGGAQPSSNKQLQGSTEPQSSTQLHDDLQLQPSTQREGSTQLQGGTQAHHATPLLVLVGPAGVGKGTAASALACKAVADGVWVAAHGVPLSGVASLEVRGHVQTQV